jgi:hypothetical protein
MVAAQLSDRPRETLGWKSPAIRLAHFWNRRPQPVLRSPHETTWQNREITTLVCGAECPRD